jgi:hypothetical protein
VSVPREIAESDARPPTRARLHCTGAIVAALVCAVAPGVTAAPPAGVAPARAPKPDPVLTPKRFPGWQAWNVAFPCVLRDPRTGQHLMYYSGTSTSRMNESIWDDWVIGLVTSKDGLTWQPPDEYEPVLLARRSLEGDVLDPEELARTFDSVAVFGASVIEDGGVYRMWYTGWNGESEHQGGGRDRMVHHRIGHATSPDGLRWTKRRGAAGVGAVLGLGATGSPDALDAAHPFVLRTPTGYRMWYEGFDGQVFRILSASSVDGLEWSREGVALGPGDAGSPDRLGARRPVIVRRGGRFELWYEGLSDDPLRYRVLRAASADLNAWTKLPGEIDLWEGRLPDPEVAVGTVVVNPDGSCRVYFSSRRTRLPLDLAQAGPRVGFSIKAVTVKP